VLALVVLTAITLITLDTRNGRGGALGVLGRAAHTIISPIERGVASVARPIGDWWHGVVDAGHLKRENQKLHDEVAQLRGGRLDAAQAIDENEKLKRLLALPILSEVPRRAARIVGRDPGNFDSTLTIDRGSEQGIAVGMPVIAPEGLVGKVIEVWHGGAKIRVVTDPAFAVGVQTPAHAGGNATTGSALGSVGSHELVVDDFDARAKVLVGDRIVTSPLSTDIPPDIRVGVVSRVDVEPGGQGMHARIKPYVDLGGLQYVVVLLWVRGQGPVVAPTTTIATPTSSTTSSTIVGGG
jgi:rod shape-determining protein MreC